MTEFQKEIKVIVEAAVCRIGVGFGSRRLIFIFSMLTVSLVVEGS